MTNIISHAKAKLIVAFMVGMIVGATLLLGWLLLGMTWAPYQPYPR
jgi:hypothetical protein